MSNTALVCVVFLLISDFYLFIYGIDNLPAQALFDLEVTLGIKIDWQQMETFCAEAGKQLGMGMEQEQDRTIPTNTALIEGFHAVIWYLQFTHHTDLVDTMPG
jgi:hypothetical protein